MKKETAEKILKETELGYDLISTKFSQTRKHFWRGLEFIGEYTKNGDAVLDFGCGNGRLLELVGNIENMRYYGADVSQGLVDIAKQKYPNANFSKISPIQTTLAFNPDFFNTIYSIAVFHHFPSKEYRENFAKELYRVTKKDGHIIITVWNLWQRKYAKNIIRNWFDKLLGKNDLDWNDCYISFTDNTVHPVKYPQNGSAEGGFNGASKFQRFHHAFTKKELRNLFQKAGFKIEKCEIINGRNIILIGKK
jgi:alkylated DNA repair protein alkB homolog 8